MPDRDRLPSILDHVGKTPLVSLVARLVTERLG
jgi:hypothetical protein